MKKKVIVNRQKLTREENLFPKVNEAEKTKSFQPQSRHHSIEKFNGYWKINFRDKR